MFRGLSLETQATVNPGNLFILPKAKHLITSTSTCTISKTGYARKIMNHLLIVFHSQSGNTERMAKAVLSGCQQEAGVETRLLHAFDATLENLLWADGLLFGTPENFGYMSGALKDFFDRTYYPAESYQINLPYAIFVSAGNDGTGAVREIDRIVKGYPLRKIAEPLIAKGDLTDEHLQQCEELGHSMATGLAMGIF